jgi:hypothetical protein
MFGGNSFRPMAQNIQLAQAAPMPTPPPVAAPAPTPIPNPSPVIVPIAPAPVIAATPAPSSMTPLLIVAGIAAGIALVVALSKQQ